MNGARLFALLLLLRCFYDPVSSAGIRAHAYKTNTGHRPVVAPQLSRRALCRASDDGRSLSGELLGVPEARGDGLEAGHGIDVSRLLRKSGVLSKVAPGIHTLLPVGRKILARLERVTRVEMARLGTHEVELPVLQPEGVIKGRQAEFGADLCSLRDRQGRSLHLSPTCEELVCRVADNVLSPLSRTQLPIRLFQIRTKFRDEVRPCDATMRCREFAMKDAYSLHADLDSACAAYAEFRAAYERILRTLDVSYSIKRSSEGETLDEEFNVTLPSPDDGAQLEVAHIFRLGTALAEEARLCYEVEGRRTRPVHLNSYGIGLHRLLYALAAQHSDADGLRLPQIAAPYDVAVIPCDRDDGQTREFARELQQLLAWKGLHPLLDDRDLPVRQRTADLRVIGVPHIVYISSHFASGTPLEPDPPTVEIITREAKASNVYHLGQSEGALLAREACGGATVPLERCVKYTHRATEGEFLIPVRRLLQLLCV
ncbi:proline-tRNA ligase [Babesia caballi]|uniref:proline--tRNA ligase n=1 Tax=Babesia caballi TaxID=5871 RepID=A0AAV4LU24_BABCB|nr:proline-tRNA ligase [Babesia caballi]